MGKTYCILGGGGAFGIQLAHYLLDQAKPAKVVGVGRSPLRPGAFSLGIEARAGYEYLQRHLIRDFDLVLSYLERLRPDVIINFAAQGEGAASWENSHLFFDTNATALVRLYEELSRGWWARGSGQYVRRFIQIGTSELYGSVTHPVNEEAPIVPSSPYAASKAAFDLYLLAMHRAGRGVPMNIIRPSNCYCPGQLLHRIIPRAIVAGLLGRKVPLHGGGRAKKSYLHARDLARAIHFVIEEGEVGRVYNVGPKYPTSIRDVAEMCAAAVGRELHDVFDIAPERLGQDGCYWLDSSAIRDLGWRPETEWPSGLRDVVAWATENLDQLRDWPTDYQLRP